MNTINWAWNPAFDRRNKLLTIPFRSSAIIVSAIAFAVFLIPVTFSHAVPILAIDSQVNTTASTGSIYTHGVGHVFEVDSSELLPGQQVQVVQLGIEGFFGSAANANGLIVKLWDTNNTVTPLAQVTFTGASTFTVVDYAHGSYDGRQYLGTLTTPVTLTAGTDYIIAAYGFSGTGTGERSYINGAPVQLVANGIDFLQERFTPSGSSGGIPTTNDGAAGVFKYGGPTFAFNLVPEPSSFVMFLFAAAAMPRFRGTRRR